jgi:Phage portal protein
MSASPSPLVIPTRGSGITALALPTAVACVTAITQAATQGRVSVERGGVVSATPEWLRRPQRMNGGIRPRDLIAGAVTDLATKGRTAWYARAVGSMSWTLEPIAADRVGVTFDMYRRRVWTVDGVATQLADGPARVSGLLPVGYLWFSDRAEPFGPLQAARYVVDGYADTETYARNVFRSGEGAGAGPRLETDADITEATAARWAEAWQASHGDPASRRIPVLGAGLKLATDVIDPGTAAWIEARRYNAQMVAALFRVPARRVGLPSGDPSTYATERDDDRAFMRSTVAGYVDPITDAWSSLLPYGRNAAEDERVVMDWSSALAPSPQEQVDYLAAAIGAGLMTTDEGRAALGLDPSVVVNAEAITREAVTA